GRGREQRRPGRRPARAGDGPLEGSDDRSPAPGAGGSGTRSRGAERALHARDAHAGSAADIGGGAGHPPGGRVRPGRGRAGAVGGREEPASRAARTLGDGLAGRVAALGAAGHVLDYDDTHEPSLAHLSAPTAPAALVLGADLGVRLSEVLEAYAAGFEAMGAV